MTLPESLLREAKALGINISQAREKGLTAAVAEAQEVEWLRENRAAPGAWNEYVETNGVPLSEFRRF